MNSTKRSWHEHPVLAHVVAEGGVVLAILLWWLLSERFPDYVLPGPLEVGAKIVELMTVGNFLYDILVTSLRVAASIFFAMLLGAAIAFVPYYFPNLTSTVEVRIRPFFNSFPAIGWVLLATIWFGVSDFTVVFVQTAILLPFCLINVGEGVRVINEELVEMGRSFGRSEAAVFLRVVLPLMAPYLLAALRISYGVAWKVGLVAELFGARSGMGFAMMRAQTYADTAGVLSICLIIVALFITVDLILIRPLGRRYRDVTGM
jgi:NitT/TauT family transport system permease protein/sulfonate transport system permease protein